MVEGCTYIDDSTVQISGNNSFLNHIASFDGGAIYAKACVVELSGKAVLWLTQQNLKAAWCLIHSSINIAGSSLAL